MEELSREVTLLKPFYLPSEKASALQGYNLLLLGTNSITKTYLYNFEPLKSYIVKLGFTGVFIIFLISAQKLDGGYSLEPPRLCLW